MLGCACPEGHCFGNEGLPASVLTPPDQERRTNTHTSWSATRNAPLAHGGGTDNFQNALYSNRRYKGVKQTAQQSSPNMPPLLRLFILHSYHAASVRGRTYRFIWSWWMGCPLCGRRRRRSSIPARRFAANRLPRLVQTLDHALTQRDPSTMLG